MKVTLYKILSISYLAWFVVYTCPLPLECKTQVGSDFDYSLLYPIQPTVETQ